MTAKQQLEKSSSKLWNAEDHTGTSQRTMEQATLDSPKAKASRASKDKQGKARQSRARQDKETLRTKPKLAKAMQATPKEARQTGQIEGRNAGKTKGGNKRSGKPKGNGKVSHGQHV